MCVTPGSLADGTPLACRKCWSCKQARTADLVGRAIAESLTADRTFSVTLTYAGDSVRNVVHCLEDVQKFVRAQRDAGLNVRYMCAGEFGETFGRVHWHFVGFWRGQCPEVPLGRRINWKFWPHGYSYFQEPDWHGLAYALKYAVKDATPGSVRPFVLSKKPPIGYHYLIELARDMARKGLPLHGPTYQFKGVRDSKGRIRTFWLEGKMRELFVKAYLGEWCFLKEFMGERREPVPATEWLFGSDEKKGYFWKLYPELDPARAIPEMVFQRLLAERQAREKARYNYLWKDYDDTDKALRGVGS